ncbi:MAG: SixA phosphatase family protein [Hyphomicrobiaceae bacterium]
MRTLSLLRHAKSSWSTPALTDCERPLAPRGLKAAPLMGRHMRDIGLVPDLVLLSPADRTRQTAELALGEAGLACVPLRIDEQLYEASADDLLVCLRECPDDIGHVLMIGHNPGLHELAVGLLGDEIPPDHADLARNLPTAALVVLAVNVDNWGDVDWGMAFLSHYRVPRDLD